MKRIGLVVLTAAATILAPSVALAAPPSGDSCVGGPGCYATLAQAIAAAPSGSTVHLKAGVFGGGVTIDKDLKLIGEGASRSIVKGGGPVIDIPSSKTGTPTVVIQGLTVTGGVTTGDEDGLGGGIYIPRTDTGAAGATVSLLDVVVAGNKVTPGKTVPSTDGSSCPDGPCPYAGAYGGGIENEGNLTLDRVIVAGNTATGHASESDGGGVFSGLGLLTVENSTITGNIASPLDIGRSSEGGGLGVWSGGLVLRDSRVDGNLATLTTSYPAKVDGTVLDLHASGGGIHIGDAVSPVDIERTDVSGNLVTADDINAEIYGFDGAMQIGNSQATMSGITVDHNVVTVRASDSTDPGPSGTAMEFDGPGTLTNSRIVDNVSTIAAGYATGAVASVTGGLAVYDLFGDPRQVTVSGTTISDNKAYAYSPKGQALVVGVGIFNNSLLAMSDDVVQGNAGQATGPQANAQGGGIWDGVYLSGPPVQLSLSGVKVTGNSLSVHGVGKALGGGLYASEKVTATSTTISGNHPDQCNGTGCP